MEIAQWLKQTRRQIDEWIDAAFPVASLEPGSVEEVMRYSLRAGGKRLRPQLILASAAYCGEDFEKFRDIALAIEYVHTYSLIHDDLPAMDNDDLRRGHLTAHKQFTEALAILAGDALLTEAFVKMGQAAKDFSAKSVVEATGVLAEAAGPRGLIRGQVLDLAAEHHILSVEDLAQIHRLKTGALFVASVRLPAILTGNRAADSLLK
ncbi:MAG: polyprenyl synthetase family protein, partial [Firmicutes bacterium]|nr:polyprenyl synthetase family protein [Bacillota bacterium]